MRVVLDTSVFVSAMLGNTLRAIIDAWRAGSFELVVSNQIVQEYLGVLRRPKFHLTSEIIDPMMALIFQQAIFVAPEQSITIIESDPSDNKFLEAALAGQASYIISGDKHLLELESYQGVGVIAAREFLSILGQES